MNLFGRGKKKITRRRPRSLEDQRRQLADRTLLNNMRNNPKVLREWIKKEHGIDIPDEDDIDAAIEGLMTKTEKDLMTKALEGAEDDEQLQGVAKEVVNQVMLSITEGDAALLKEKLTVLRQNTHYGLEDFATRI